MALSLMPPLSSEGDPIVRVGGGSLVFACGEVASSAKSPGCRGGWLAVAVGEGFFEDGGFGVTLALPFA